MAAGLSRVYAKPANYKKIAKETSINLNIEESGLTWGLLPIFNTYKAKFIKTDAEYKYSINFPKKSIVLRAFVGVGVPLGRDTSLPFIKQYFGGGSNSINNILAVAATV